MAVAGNAVMVATNEIQAVLDHSAEACEPQRVVPSGAQARGTPGRDTDAGLIALRGGSCEKEGSRGGRR